jgi:peroxiredoxin
MRAFKLIVLGIPLITLVLSSYGCKEKRSIAVEGLRAPDFSIKDVGGNTWRLSDMMGSVVLINFWASWCEPCREELPSIQKMYESMKGEPGFRFASILYRDDPTRAYAYMQQNGYTFPLLVDPDGSVSSAYGLTGVPETFLIDKRGVLVKKIVGPADYGSPEAISYFKGFIEK